MEVLISWFSACPGKFLLVDAFDTHSLTCRGWNYSYIAGVVGLKKIVGDCSHSCTEKCSSEVQAVSTWRKNIKKSHLKVTRVVSIKLFFIDWFYYDLIILINAKPHLEI